MKPHRVLLFSLAAGLFAFAVSGCTSQEQWQAAFLSGTVGYTEAGGNWTMNKQGSRSGDTHEYAMTYTMQPGAYWAWKMQAEMAARAITEREYADRAPPPPPKCPQGAVP